MRAHGWRRVGNLVRVALATFASLALVGCVNGLIGIRGSGNTTTETREVDGFTEIVLEGSGEVNVQIGDSEALTIEAEDNLISSLSSEVENGALVLGTTGSISPTRGIVYTVTATELNGVTINGSGEVAVADASASTFTTRIDGSGKVDLANLTAERLEVTISGSGDVDVTGSSDELLVEIPGSGAFDGVGLESSTGDVSISGSGAAVVNVTDTLNATVSGSGDIEYLGSPAVSSTISGSGTVTQG